MNQGKVEGPYTGEKGCTAKSHLNVLGIGGVPSNGKKKGKKKSEALKNKKGEKLMSYHSSVYAIKNI